MPPIVAQGKGRADAFRPIQYFPADIVRFPPIMTLR